MKNKIFALILAVCMLIPMMMLVIPSAAESHFIDVKKGRYYYDAVNWAVESGITNGTTVNSFSPDMKCTRGQAVTFLWRLNGEEIVGETKNNFTDIKPDVYYSDAVNWAVYYEITNGKTEELFAPDEVLTRGQFVTFLWRIAGKPTSSAALPFDDVERSSYCYDAVAWASDIKLTNGISERLFGINDICNRAQIVTFLYRMKCGSGEVYLDVAEEHDIHTELQKYNIDGFKGLNFKTTKFVTNEEGESELIYFNGTNEYSKPIPLEVSYVSNVENSKDVILVSEKSDLSRAQEWPASNGKAVILNPVCGKTYYIAVKSENSNGVSYSRTKKVKIIDSDYTLYGIDGVTNVRDLGGKEMANGKKMKCGMIYRSGKLDNITDAGKAEFKRLRIKTELDLRIGVPLTLSPAGNISYQICGMYSNQMVGDSTEAIENRAGAKKAFHIFANRDNYPIDFHCEIGTDRTGYIAIVLLGLAGVHERTIMLDYLLSNYGTINGVRNYNNFQQITGYINAGRPTGTFQQHCYQHLIYDIGVPKEEVDSIISIITE